MPAFVAARRCSLLCIAIAAMLIGIFSSVAQALTPTSEQPIADYSFDEGTGATAEDLTGSGHTATIENATWARGRYGDSLAFNGTNACVKVPVTEDLQATEEFTVEAWVRPEGTGATALPVIALNDEKSKGEEAQIAYELFAGNGQTPKAWVRKGGSSGTNNVYGEGALPEKAWSHIALTDDGSVIRLYVNGVLGKEENSTNVAPLLTAAEGPLSIGCGIEYGTYKRFKGRIDEVRVYNRALSAAEVPADAAAPIETAPAGPVADYSFDEEATAGEDLSGNGHTATIEGATWTPRGRFGGAMQFNGSSACLSIADAADLRAGEEFTLESWVRPEGELKKLPVIFKEGSSYLNYSLQIGHATTGRAEGSIGTSGTPHNKEATATKELPANAWSHLATTFDGSSLRLYFNGSLVATKAITGAESGREGALKIGCDSQYGEHFKGRIDEARIYDRVISEAEVQRDQAAPIQTPQRGPIADYSFDEGTGATAEDLTGYGHTATIENATWARGRYGDSLAFNGTNACVKVPVTEDLQATEEFTVEAWVRPEGTGATALPVIAINDEKSKGEEAQIAYELFAGNGQTPKAWVRKGGSSGTNNVYGEGALPEKAWSHIALTDDGSVIRLYVNGVLGKEENSTNVAPLLTAAEGPLSIGCGIEYGTYKRFKGRIDEVRIYNRALSAAEVPADAAAPIETAPAGPVADYSFDEEATAGEDLTGNGHTATIEGATWTPRGRFGGAMQFNGSSACLSIADAADLRAGEEFTLESLGAPRRRTEKTARHLQGRIELPELLPADRPRHHRQGGRLDRHLGDPPQQRSDGDQRTPGQRLVPPRHHLRRLEPASLLQRLPSCHQSDHRRRIRREGALKIGCDSQYGEHFKGRIDEARIYDRVISEAEVQRDQAAPIQTPQRGPIADYSFDEGTGATAEDLTGYGHTATIENATWARGRYGDSLAFNGTNACVKVPVTETSRPRKNSRSRPGCAPKAPAPPPCR